MEIFIFLFFLPLQQLSSALSSAYVLAYIANNMDPGQTAPFWSSLIRVYSVCFLAEISRVHLNILCK